MNTIERFSTKAQLYDRYRWDYAPEAIEAMIDIGKLQPAAIVADVGSGTGSLSRLFLRAGLFVYAIEPNDKMRRIAEQNLSTDLNFRSIDARSEATALLTNSVNVVAVGRALHWLPAETSRLEFTRILKPGGLLAILSTPCHDTELLEAVRSIQTEANGWDIAQGKSSRPRLPFGFYFGGDHYQKLTFSRHVNESWDQFFGRLCSLSSAPDNTDPLFERFEQAAITVYDQFSNNGRLTTAVSTDLIIGQLI